MAAFPLEQLHVLLLGRYLLVGVLWLGLGVLSVGLLVMMHTRWGQLHPLRKCFLLSLLAHLLVAGYSTTLCIGPSSPAREDRVIRVSLADDPAGAGPAGPAAAGRKSDRPTASPVPKVLPRVELPQPPPTPATSAAKPPPASPPPKTSSPEPAIEKLPAAKLSEPIRADRPQGRQEVPVAPPAAPGPQPSQTAGQDRLRPIRGEPRAASAGAGAGVRAGASGESGPGGPGAQRGHRVPSMYRLRFAADRSQQAERRGSSPQAEAAVAAALAWLARNQEQDGRWNASRHGAGRESLEEGRDRLGAGSNADTAVTALAILAFAASGNTHRQGAYPSALRGAVLHLLSIQGEDGNLAGSAAIYEFMYCHGMAALALGELFGMTGDEYLREPLRRAVAYTVAAQDPAGGGWRYRPRQPGDTSQLGWQLMALKSAEAAGIVIPEATWHGASRFLEDVSAGASRGLASYRPGERISRAMTAEALACRQFLGLSPHSPTSREAGDHLLGELPGTGPANLYYWYYGTLAMYQLQGTYWDQWARALQPTLLAGQHTSGPLAGSWDPNTRWDSYGGRVYSTALATLCLEAFYRFAPPADVAESADRPGRR